MTTNPEIERFRADMLHVQRTHPPLTPAQVRFFALSFGYRPGDLVGDAAAPMAQGQQSPDAPPAQTGQGQI